jgi:hypothetical protein
MRAYLETMLRLALTAILAFAATAAEAYCISTPDTAATGYVANSTALTLCLQSELAQRAAEMAEKARLDAELGNLQIQLERQRLLMLQQPALPPPPQL